MSDNDHRELPLDAAESKTLRMRGNALRENREAPRISSSLGGGERSDKASRRTADMHVLGKSDGFVVPTKRANKAGPLAVAESVEGRESAKGNADQALPYGCRTQRRNGMASDWKTYGKRCRRLPVITQGRSRMR